MSEISDNTATLKCPKCAADMEKVQFEQIEVDRCTACKGLWFDMLEREHLATLKNAESIDTGTPHQEKREEKVKADCPRCHTRMIRMVDHQQPHIWFESCPVCYGVFYDAGEFRDYKSHTVVDFFKDLFRKQRD